MAGVIPSAPAVPDPFAPAGVTWQPVSARLATGRRVVLLGGAAVVLVVVVTVGLLTTRWALLLMPAVAVGATWGWLLIGRQVRAMGYAERADDLLIRQGILLRRIVVVPYGRLQFVDVQAGPLARLLDYSAVQLHTASAGSDAVIEGLPPAEAARLRDRLAQRGEARLAGL
ncbi:MAG: PH domain-containing protein [Angustibacter sp.]